MISHLKSHNRFVCLSLVVPLWLTGIFAAGARDISFSIIHTTDLHGHLLPAYDYEGNEDVGGFLRCATLIRELRAKIKHSHLVDCGDLIQGGAESFASGGRLMLRALEAMKYDAWVIGNHEFDWGIENLKKLHDETTSTMLAANMYVRPTFKNPLPKVKPYIIKEVEGVRVAYIGLTTPGIPAWSRPYLLGPMLFRSSVDALKEIMPKIRERKPDVLVLLLHQGYKAYGDDHANQVKAIAKSFPEFDVIIGGHTHRVVESLELGTTLYTQAGYHGNWVGQVDLVYDNVKKQLIRKTAKIFAIANHYKADPGLSALFEKELAASAKKQNRVIGSTKAPLVSTGRIPGQSPQQALISKAIQEATGADIVIHGALDDRKIPAGNIREKDIWKVVPYENSIGLVQLNIGEIEEILEENARRAKSMYYMGVLGLCYDLEVEGEAGRRVHNLRLPGNQKIHPRKKFKVAFNSYVLASGGRRLNRLRAIAERPASRLEMLHVNTRDMVRDYVKKHSPLNLKDDHCVSRYKKGD